MSRRKRSRRISYEPIARTEDASLRSSGADESWLVLARESAVNASAFDMMVKKVMANLRHYNIPGLSDAERIGAEIFRSEEIRAGLDGLQELRRSNARPGSAPYGYLFRIDGTWFLFAQISARLTSQNQDNDFTRDLTETVRRIRPSHLGTGPTTRLCRHRDHVAMLNLALENVGGRPTHVVCDESEGRALNLRVAADRERWDEFCKNAVTDYVSTRRRLTSGTANYLALGEYTFAEDTLPPGYRLEDSDTFYAQPDPSWRAFVAEVIKVSARDYAEDTDLDPRAEWLRALKEVVKVCDRHGWISGELRRRLGPEAKFSDARYPDRNAQRMWTYLPLWLSGEYVMRHKLDLGLGEHQKHFNGVELERGLDENGESAVYMVKRLMFGTFDWTEAERALLLAAIERRSLDKRPRGRGGRKPGQSWTNTAMLPLLSLCEFVDGQWQYRLVRNGSESYSLVRRPVTDTRYPNGSRRGWAAGEGQPLATIQTAAVHHAMSTAAVRLIEEGGIARALTRLPLTDPDETGADSPADRAKQETTLSNEIDRLVRRASVLREQETDARIEGNAAAADDYKAKALKCDGDVTRLRRDLSELMSPTPPVAVIPPEGTTTDLRNVAVALATLARTEAAGPLLLHEALTRIITGMRVIAGVSSVTVSFSVRVPTSNGQVTLGPATVTLPNTRQENKTERMEEMLELYFLQGLSWEEIGHRVTRSPELALGQIRKHLVATFPQLSAGARTAILQCPIPATRRIVWHMLSGAGSVADLPAAWVAHVSEIYSSDIYKRRTWAAGDHALRREVLAYMLAHQSDPESGVSVFDAARVTGRSVWRITPLVDPTPVSPGLVAQPSYERVDECKWGTKRVTAQARIRARMCPWCRTRTATHVLRVPECPDDLLCTSCFRMPSDPTVVFPQEYLALWIGGSAAGARSTNTTEAAERIEVPVEWKMRRRRAS